MWQLFHLFRFDVLGAIMVALILTIAWLIFDFSRIYLMGEEHLKRHCVFFAVTVASACIVAITDDLIVMALCWSLTGIAVQRLLLFYPHRVFAQIAARKKALLSRIADLAMLACVVELWRVFHTTSLSDIAQLVTTIAPGDVHITIAALCVVLAVAIRCAQIPFHGWILQVMEAPTPVSALLHAGVVNIGGFVLLRLAPILERTNVARDALIVIGACSAVTAALVMTTRVSIKVSLAWSTCAQMGCMLVEAGIGAYPLVVLHLIGHSLYKSYAFLHAGNTVHMTRVFAQTPALQAPPMQASRYVRLAVVVFFACLGWFGGMALTHDPCLAVGMLLSSLAIMHLFNLGAGDRRLWQSLVGGSALLLVMYILGERAAQIVILPAAIGATHFQIILAGAAFIILGLLDSVIVREPHSRLSRKLYAYAFAGFHLDEVFTRGAVSLGLLSLRKEA